MSHCDDMEEMAEDAASVAALKIECDTWRMMYWELLQKQVKQHALAAGADAVAWTGPSDVTERLRARAERRAMELQAANDALRAQFEALRAELRQAEAEPVEVQIPVRELAVAMTTLTTPEPYQNHTETIPIPANPPAKARMGMSAEARAAAAERMRAWQATRAEQRRAAKEAAQETTTPSGEAQTIADSWVAACVETREEPAPIEAEAVVEPDPASAATLNPTLSARMDAAADELRQHIDAGGEISEPVLSALAGKHRLSRQGVESLLTGRMVMAHMRKSDAA